MIIGHRLHEVDLFGHLLSRGGWHHLCLPAEYEPDHPHCCRGDPRTELGQLLWPARYSAASLQEWKRSMSSYRVAGMLQQRPAPAGGAIFQRPWFQYYPPDSRPEVDWILLSWDSTFTGSDSSDYVVGQVWGARGPDRYLLAQTRARMGFTDTIVAIHGQRRWVSDAYPGEAARGSWSRSRPTVRPSSRPSNARWRASSR